MSLTATQIDYASLDSRHRGGSEETPHHILNEYQIALLLTARHLERQAAESRVDRFGNEHETRLSGAIDAERTHDDDRATTAPVQHQRVSCGLRFRHAVRCRRRRRKCLDQRPRLLPVFFGRADNYHAFDAHPHRLFKQLRRSVIVHVRAGRRVVAPSRAREVDERCRSLFFEPLADRFAVRQIELYDARRLPNVTSLRAGNEEGLIARRAERANQMAADKPRGARDRDWLKNGQGWPPCVQLADIPDTT